jgi:hypothetical protein
MKQIIGNIIGSPKEEEQLEKKNDKKAEEFLQSLSSAFFQVLLFVPSPL